MFSSNEKSYWVYMLSNSRRTVLYTGVTSNLISRLWDHRHGSVELHRFTSRYNVTDLVYYEQFGSILEAISREKQIKSWARGKKEKLINDSNTQRRDLSDDWE